MSTENTDNCGEIELGGLLRMSGALPPIPQYTSVLMAWCLIEQGARLYDVVLR